MARRPGPAGPVNRKLRASMLDAATREKARIRAVIKRRDAMNPEPTFRKVEMVTTDFVTELAVAFTAPAPEPVTPPPSPPQVAVLFRRCVNPGCYIDIRDRSPKTKRCRKCAAEHHRVKRRDRRAAIKVIRPARTCEDCPADITALRTDARRCEACAIKRNRDRAKGQQGREDRGVLLRAAK